MVPRTWIAVLALFIAAPSVAEEPFFKIELQKSSDRVAVETTKLRVLFSIECQSGIGGATIKPTKERWPDEVAIQLRYNKESGFRMLESFVVKSERLLIDGNLATSGAMPFAFLDPKSESKLQNVEKPAGLMAILVEKSPERIELAFPKQMLHEKEEVRIRWIDAFR